MGGDRIKLLGCALVVAALGAVFPAALAGAAATSKPTYVPISVFAFTPNGGFTPTLMSKTKPIPIALTISGQVKMLDGSHPPALTGLAVQLDKNISVNLRGFPACHGVRIQIDPPMTLEERCRSSIIGAGTEHFEIKFPEGEPTSAKGRLLIINGPLRDGIRTLFVDTTVSEPVTGHLVSTIEIKKIHNGRFGTEAIFTFPKIAGGSASITSFDARIKKRLPLEGKRFSPVTARCRDGKLAFHFVGNFLDYSTNEVTNASAEAPRTCTGD